MQFKKLRLQGFKSFVDPTDLEIREGLTGVVGPNGCGKSNLLEALRWVMGENRPTQMRGGGMEDVIFAGAASRGAKHFAEVSLVIDNSERLAPAAFNQNDEIEVIRRITRDIGSAYKLNGKDVRARDVSMMFADAATGSHSPSLVRQGQITELINSKPQARRRVLEDAAGISGLYQRRHEAELKLKNAESNLLRVDDTLDQLATQIRSLDRQAKTAERYKELAEKLRGAQAILAYLEWKALSEKCVESERQVTQARTKRSEGERLRRTCEAELDRANQALPALRDEEAIAAALLQRHNIALTSLSEDEARAQKTIEELERSETLLTRDLERERQISQDASEALNQLKWEEEHLKEAANGEEDAIQKAAEIVRVAHEDLAKTEEAFDDIRQTLARDEARAQAAERRHSEAKTHLNKLEVSTQKAQQELQEIRENQKITTQNFEESAREVEVFEEKITHLSSQSEELETLNHKHQNSFDEILSNRATRQGEISALKAEQKGLAAILSKSESEAPLLEQIEVEKGYEAAIGAAIDHELDAPENDNGSGWRFTGEILPPDWPENVQPLSPFINAPKLLQKRLSYIGVTEKISTEMQNKLLPGQRLVSFDGDLYRWDGYVKLASDGDAASRLHLEQRNRFRELNTLIEKLQAELSVLESQKNLSQKNLETAKENLQKNQSELRISERALTDAIRKHQLVENNLERLNSRLEVNQNAIEGIEHEVSRAKEEFQTAEAALVDQNAIDQKKFELEKHHTNVENAREFMLSKRATLEDLRKERERRQNRLKDITRERENWQKRLNNTTRHQDELEQRRADTSTKLKHAKAHPSELAQKRVLLESDIENAQVRVSNAKEALASGESERARSDQKHREAENSLADIREELARFESELEALKNDLEEAQSQISENYNKAPEALGSELLKGDETLPNKDTVRAEIDRLIRQREALGAVNLRADEDRAEIINEHGKLNSDKAEITEAIAKLRQAISTLNKEGRERLLAAFDEVNQNFTSLFQKLFGGGSAHLELVESDDPLNAGLEIMCQPPGKKLATLSLLSGGEQTLTAISLIFAVFLTNPSPICVLDEVDAPLDDANVTRFCNMLEEMVGQTQTRFLVITHHALTMSRMHRLFGVTMGEKGVSQLVSVDLSRAEEIVQS